MREGMRWGEWRRERDGVRGWRGGEERGGDGESGG